MQALSETFIRAVSLINLFIVGIFFVGCSQTRHPHTIDNQLFQFIDTQTISSPARKAVYHALMPLENSIANMQVVSVTLNHDGSWSLRDRQALHNGDIVITDYSIWINDEEPHSHCIIRTILVNKSELLKLMRMSIECWATYANVQSRSGGTAARLHITVHSGFGASLGLNPSQLATSSKSRRSVLKCMEFLPTVRCSRRSCVCLIII